MKTLKLAIILTLWSIIWSPSLAEAKPRFIRLIDELKAASIVAVVRIESYEKDHLVCVPSNNLNGKLVISYSTDKTWNPTGLVVNDLKSVETGVWPPVGSSVVVVANGDRVVSLFAVETDGQWRFWSPWLTGSSASFECSVPSRVLQPTDGKDFESWEGCVITNEKLEPFYKQ